MFKGLSNFGNFLKEKEEKEHAKIMSSDLLSKEGIHFASRPCEEPAVVPKVQDVIGNALPRIGPYVTLDNQQQKVALIDDVSGNRKTN